MSNTEWKKVKLGDIGKLTMGSTPSTKVAEYYGGDRLWITPSDIVKGNKYVSETERKLTDLGWSEARHIPANSILITCIASIGKNCIATEEVSCNQQIIALTPSEDYDVHYLYYAICSIENQLHSIAGKATVEIVNKTKLSSVEIDVPPLEEQRRIASLLSRFDELIQLHEFKAENLIKAKQQIMSDIFSGGLRELESINPDDYVQDNWRMMRLGDCTIVTMGQSPKGNEITETGKQLFMQGSAEFGNKFPKPFKYCDVSKRICNVGDILMSVRAPVGAVNMADDRYGFGRGLCSLSPSILCSEYIYYVVKGLSNKIAELGHGSTVQAITIQEVKDFKVPVPPTIEEQHKIANLLSSYDSLIELKRSQKQQVTNMKQQLMYQLLTNGGGAEQLGNC